MSAYPALRHLRVGCVQYLNSRPLIDAYDGAVHYDHPSALAEQLRAGELDVALCPSIELFVQPESYYAVEGAAIASRGPVYSVFLAYQGELKDVHRVALDPASRTSVFLARYLFERNGMSGIEYLSETERETDARVLIGNQAIRFRQAAGPEWRFLDFGEEWRRLTGHPFVYALWLVREDSSEAREAAVELRAIKQAGQAALSRICEEGGEFGSAFCMEYLSRYICFELGAEEKGGLWEFGRALQEMELVPRVPIRPIFI